MGVCSVVVRGFTSWRSAIVEWVASVVVALVVGSAVKDYLISEGLYNACVATSSFFGIYLVKGCEKIAKSFANDPCNVIDKVRGKCKKDE